MGGSTSPARTRRRRGWRRAAVALVALAAALVAPIGPAAPEAGAAPTRTARAAASPDVESQFVGRINSLRASKGLGQLQVSGELVGVARRWTERMVANGDISHNPNLGSQVSGNWTKLGENVGVGSSVDSLMQAFINSSSHYRNLVDPEWNYLGVGVVTTPDGQIWTTHNFMAKPVPAPTPPPSAAPTAKAASAPKAKPAAAPAAVAPPPVPKPTPERVGAVLTPLRSLERN